MEAELRNCWRNKRAILTVPFYTHRRDREDMNVPMCLGCSTVWKKDVWADKHAETSKSCLATHMVAVQSLHAECVALTGVIPPTAPAAEAAAAGSGSQALIEKQRKELDRLKAQVNRQKKHLDAHQTTEDKFFEAISRHFGDTDMSDKLYELHQAISVITSGCFIRDEYDEEEMENQLSAIDTKEHLGRRKDDEPDYTALEMAEERRRREAAKEE